MRKERQIPKTKGGRINLRAWASDLTRRETGRYSRDRVPVAQATELLNLMMSDLYGWYGTHQRRRGTRKATTRWTAFIKTLNRRRPRP